MDAKDKQKLRKQLADALTNLSLVEDRIAEYVTDTEVPLKYFRAKEKLEQKIVDLKAKLGINGGGIASIIRINLWKALVGALAFGLVGLVGGVYWFLQPTPIEAFPHNVTAYSGLYDEEVRNGRGSLEAVIAEPSVVDHKFRSSIESNRYGYAGIGFYFQDDLDLSQSQYKAIKLIMSFEDAQGRCSFGISDSDGDKDHVHNIGDSQPIGHNVTVVTDGNRQEIQIPLADNFENVNLTKVRELGCTTETAGDHVFVIHDVYFIK
jgi:hypothetical protein